MNDVLQSYKQDLAIKGYSPKTQKTYFACVTKFLRSVGKPLPDLGKSDVKSHLYNLIKSGRCSSSTMNQAYSSLKYLFLQTLGKPWEMEGIPRVKKPKTLPKVLSIEEAFSIIKNAANEKHMVMLMLAYSAGLRVGELTRIKPANIIKDKMRVRIDHGKGNKDRYTILSELCLAHLRSYWKKYRPAEWMFEGYTRGKPISERACQHAFDLAKLKAGINREGGIHSLRHSFATHFLEAGGGIFQLQKFLGHKHIKTTLVYAHLQEEKTIARSPLDVYAHAGMFADR